MGMYTYIVNIDKPFIKTAFESFVKLLGIKAKKVEPQQTEPSKGGDISALFGIWKDDKVDAKELRRKAWSRNTTW